MSFQTFFPFSSVVGCLPSVSHPFFPQLLRLRFFPTPLPLAVGSQSTSTTAANQAINPSRTLECFFGLPSSYQPTLRPDHLGSVLGPFIPLLPIVPIAQRTQHIVTPKLQLTNSQFLFAFGLQPYPIPILGRAVSMKSAFISLYTALNMSTAPHFPSLHLGQK